MFWCCCSFCCFCRRSFVGVGKFIKVSIQFNYYVITIYMIFLNFCYSLYSLLVCVISVCVCVFLLLPVIVVHFYSFSSSFSHFSSLFFSLSCCSYPCLSLVKCIYIVCPWVVVLLLLLCCVVWKTKRADEENMRDTRVRVSEK